MSSRLPAFSCLLAASTMTGCTRVDLEERTRGIERLSAVAGVERVTLTWDPVAGASEYVAIRSTAPTLATVDETVTSEAFAVLSGLAADVPVYIAVRARVDGALTDIDVVLEAVPLAEVALAPSAEVFGEDTLGRSTLASDLDGDGFDEILAGCPDCSGPELNEGVFFVYGSASASAFGTPLQLGGVDEVGAASGTSLATLDSDGDGDLEVVSGAPRFPIPGVDAGAAALIEGTPFGLDPAALSLLPMATTPEDAMGHALAAGDFDGDGFDDLAVGGPGSSAAAGDVEIFAGAPGGLLPALTLDGTDDVGLDGDSRFGEALAAGDFNGDGFDDLVAGSPGETSDAGAVRIFFGAAGGLTTAAGATSLGGTDRRHGARLAMGDVTGDGRDEVAVADAPVGSSPVVRLFRGGDPDFDQTWIFTGSTAVPSISDDAISLAFGDFDGDGRADLAVGEKNHTIASPLAQNVGRVLVFLGSTQVAGTPDLTFEGDDIDRFLGRSVAFGDVDADGFDELIAGGDGVIALFRGRRTEGPRVNPGLPARVSPGFDVSIDGVSFDDPVDPDGAHVCAITWGDGSGDSVLDPCSPGDVGSVTHAFVERGTFHVVIRVTAEDGRIGEGMMTVHVE